MREAIAEAASRPTMRFVAVKSVEKQSSAMTFKARDLLVGQRTQTINALRGHLAEYGVRWVSLSFPHFGGIGGNARFDDGVVGSRSDGHRLLDEAVKQEAAGL